APSRRTPVPVRMSVEPPRPGLGMSKYTGRIFVAPAALRTSVIGVAPVIVPPMRSDPAVKSEKSIVSGAVKENPLLIAVPSAKYSEPYVAPTLAPTLMNVVGADVSDRLLPAGPASV